MERPLDKLTSYLERCKRKTPPFYRKLRVVGVVLAAAGTAVVGIPTLPAIAATIGGYMIAGGTIISAVSQAAIEETDVTNLNEVE